MDRTLPFMKCRAWNVISRVYRAIKTKHDNLGPQSSPSISSSSSRGEASSSSPGRDRSCNSEACRYCHAVEKTLLWENFTFLINVYLIIALSVAIWIYGVFGISISRIPYRILTIYLIIQLTIALQFMDTLAPTEEHQRVCSRLHWLWRSLQQLRSEQPGLYCTILCLVAFGLWLFRHVNPSTHHSIYWGIILGPLIMRLPFKLSDKLSEYFKSHREWEYDNEIEDEFLPVVTEANLQVLNRVGDTGDHSPTPTSVLSDTQNDSFYDEDFIEAFHEKMLNLPYDGEGSTDGVEMSELELSAGENDAENEDDIKFQTGHFKKSSSSSSEEEAFDAKKIITVSSNESNSDSDFEIIDKEEIIKMEM